MNIKPLVWLNCSVMSCSARRDILPNKQHAAKKRHEPTACRKRKASVTGCNKQTDKTMQSVCTTGCLHTRLRCDIDTLQTMATKTPTPSRPPRHRKTKMTRRERIPSVWGHRESRINFVTSLELELTCPKVYPAPLGEIPQPHRSSGSDHTRSHIGPSWGTWSIRYTVRGVDGWGGVMLRLVFLCFTISMTHRVWHYHATEG